MDARLVRAMLRHQEQAEQEAQQEADSEMRQESQAQPPSNVIAEPSAAATSPVLTPAAVAVQGSIADAAPYAPPQRSCPADTRLLRALQQKQEALIAREAPPVQSRGLKLSTEQRREREKLFTSAVRRDIYAVLVGTKGRSAMPINSVSRARAHTGAPARLPPEEAEFLGRLPLDSVLCERAAGALEELPRFFITRYHDDVPQGYARLDRADLLATIPRLGTTPLGDDLQECIALTEAFEEFLALELVPFWTESDAASLSTPFLCAFHVEMTPRLDVWHRIRSQSLAACDLRYLLDKGVATRNDLAVFQDLDD